MKPIHLLLVGLLAACSTASATEFANTSAAFEAEMGYSVALYDETRDCTDSYYAEKRTDEQAAPGCWLAIDDGTGQVIIISQFPALPEEEALEILVPEYFDVLSEPQWNDGPYSEQANAQPTPAIGDE